MSDPGSGPGAWAEDAEGAHFARGVAGPSGATAMHSSRGGGGRGRGGPHQGARGAPAAGLPAIHARRRAGSARIRPVFSDARSLAVVLGDRTPDWHVYGGQPGHLVVTSRDATSLENTIAAKALRVPSPAALAYEPRSGAPAHDELLMAAAGLTHLAVTNASLHETFAVGRVNVSNLAAAGTRSASAATMTGRADSGIAVAQSDGALIKDLTDLAQQVAPEAHAHPSKSDKATFTMTGAGQYAGTSALIVCSSSSLAELAMHMAGAALPVPAGGAGDKRIEVGYANVAINHGSSAAFKDAAPGSMPLITQRPTVGPGGSKQITWVGGISLPVIVRPLNSVAHMDEPAVTIPRHIIGGEVMDACLGAEGEEAPHPEDIHANLHALSRSCAFALLDMRLAKCATGHSLSNGSTAPRSVSFTAHVYNEAVAAEMRKGRIWRVGNQYGALEIVFLDTQPDGGYACEALHKALTSYGVALLPHSSGGATTVCEANLPSLWQYIDTAAQAAHVQQLAALAEVVEELEEPMRSSVRSTINTAGSRPRGPPLYSLLRSGMPTKAKELSERTPAASSNAADSLFVLTEAGYLALSQITPSKLHEGSREWRTDQGIIAGLADPYSLAAVLLMGGAGESVSLLTAGHLPTLVPGLKLPDNATAYTRLFTQADVPDPTATCLRQRWAPLAVAEQVIQHAAQQPAAPAMGPPYTPADTAERVAAYNADPAMALVAYLDAIGTLVTSKRSAPAPLVDTSAPQKPKHASPIKRDKAAYAAALAKRKQERAALAAAPVGAPAPGAGAAGGGGASAAGGNAGAGTSRPGVRKAGDEDNTTERRVEQCVAQVNNQAAALDVEMSGE